MKKMTRVARRKKRLKKKIFYIFLSLIFITMIIYSGYTIYHWILDNHNVNQIEEELEKSINLSKVDDTGELINPPEDKTDDYWYYTKLAFHEVDFSELLKKNPDTVAFIHVPNTNINYPIVQAKNNNYYLNHAFDRSYNDAGWVYMDYRNQNNFVNDNTIIYGHGRLNKTVFGSLKDTLTNNWQKEKSNYAIYISTPTENLVYQIFSIYTIEAENYYIQPNFANDNEKISWLSTMKKRNISPVDVSVNAKDQIITLSTCQNNNGGRIVVQGKLVKKQKRTK